MFNLERPFVGINQGFWFRGLDVKTKVPYGFVNSVHTSKRSHVLLVGVQSAKWSRQRSCHFLLFPLILFVCQIVLHKDALICELVPNQFSAKNTKPTTKGLAKPIHFPPKENLFYSDSSAHTICQRKALGIEEDSTLRALFRKNGRINISKTDLIKKPKPSYAMVFSTDQGEEVTIFATYFKEKARIYKFAFDNDQCAN